jgi:hypothetical protein
VTDVSRRAVLRGVSIAGAAGVGAAAGVGTHALLSDGERFQGNALSSGSLDLQVAAETELDGDVSHSPPQNGPFPSTFAEESGVTVDFPTIDPGTGEPSGSTTVAFRVCDNPGRVWLRALSADADSALAEALEVELAYASTCGAATTTVYEGSLSGLLDALSDGVRPGGGCRELGKVELEGGSFVVEAEGGGGDSLAVDDVPGELTLDGPEGPVAVEIAGLHWKDEEGDAEVRGVDLASVDVEFCRVDVKGGGGPSEGIETYRPGCDSTATGLLAGENPGGQPSGLSHFVVFACGSADCVGCEPACLTLDWTLPDPGAVAEESLSLDLELYADQCRHTTSENPWT